MFNPRNWLGETRKEEVLRRLEAAEGNVQEAHLRINELENRINLLYALISPPEGTSDDTV
jgi:hypothetical protein